MMSRKIMFLLMPFALCGCFPEVNAPQLSELPMTDRRHTAADVQASQEERQQDLEEIQSQRENLLKEENK